MIILRNTLMFQREWWFLLGAVRNGQRTLEYWSATVLPMSAYLRSSNNRKLTEVETLIVWSTLSAKRTQESGQLVVKCSRLACLTFPCVITHIETVLDLLMFFRQRLKCCYYRIVEVSLHKGPHVK